MPRPILQAGKLRHRVEIIVPDNSQDGSGGIDPDAGTTLATVWASIEPVSGRELQGAQQIVSQVTHKITIRWLDGVQALQRVNFEDRVFQIQYIQNPNETHKMLILLCIERNQ